MSKNSRMKDFFDLYTLSRYMDFEGTILCHAVKATFDRRGTVVSGKVPIGLTETFANDSQKQIQWRAFLKKNGIESVSLGEVVVMLSSFLIPVVEAVFRDSGLSCEWKPGGPWK